MWKLASVVACGLVVSALNGVANAATYNFNFTFDGTDVTLDPGSDTPAGTVLNPGDDFLITMSAADGGLWKVTSDYSAFVPLSFQVSEADTRNANISTSWLLNGVEQESLMETNAIQDFVHVGSQNWSLSTGTMFDQVTIQWDFNSIVGGGSTTIVSVTDFFNGFGQPGVSPFFTADNIEYQVVPIPAALPLFATALGCAGFFGWRRRRQRV